MEQNNLVVTPDGKTWDEVTRDVSYIGKGSLQSATDTETTWGTYIILDEWRGTSGVKDYYNKDWAIAYDRWMCLRDGMYTINIHFGAFDVVDWALKKNGSNLVTKGYSANDPASGARLHTENLSISTNFKRGDYLRMRGEFGYNPQSMGTFDQNWLQIDRN